MKQHARYTEDATVDGLFGVLFKALLVLRRDRLFGPYWRVIKATFEQIINQRIWIGDLNAVDPRGGEDGVNQLASLRRGVFGQCDQSQRKQRVKWV